jgi:integrase
MHISLSPQRQADVIGRRLRRIYDAAGITPRGAHRLRDTFAVEFLNSGGLIEDLAMLLRHNNTNTTWQHYAPWVKSRQIRLDSAVERSLAIQLARPSCSAVGGVEQATVTVQ